MNPQSPAINGAPQPNQPAGPPQPPRQAAPQVNDVAPPAATPQMPPATAPAFQSTPMAGNDIAAPPLQRPPLPPTVNPLAISLEPAPLPPSPTSRPVSFQPDTPIHAAATQIERIDETPQRNSKDIEGLITRQHRLKRFKSFGSLLVFIAGVALAAFAINNFVFQSYYVDGTSMTPTLHNDDRLIIDKVEHTVANIQSKPYIPQRGQIIVLDSSIVGVSGHPEQLIKRVIGLPGDTVIIKDGVVTITNAAHPDGFDVNKELGLKLEPTFSSEPLTITIPDGHVYVMGDNRVENGSYDSRAFGPIPASKIVGRLWARILPIDKAQVF